MKSNPERIGKRSWRRLTGVCILAAILILTLCAWKSGESMYAGENGWAILEADKERAADVFLIGPTVETGLSGKSQMSLENEYAKTEFLKSLNMERGIYEDTARIFAPYYRQAAFPVYALPPEQAEPYFQLAFRDVKDAFLFYMEKYNDGRPLILAGYSQGADMALRLMEELFWDEQYQNLLVAAYCPGWRVTDADLEKYPWLHMAQNESDTGVIISFNSEDAGVNTTLIVPAGMKTRSINPVNWKTDGTWADSSENLGACFVDGNGTLVREVPNLTGAYLDSERGTLKTTDIKKEDYSSFPFPAGVYHAYEMQFYYRNLQKNVAVRTEAFLNKNKAERTEK